MRRFGTILAERGLVEQDSGRSVRVSLGVPRAGTGGAEWECPFRIHGAGLSRVESGYGMPAWPKPWGRMAGRAPPLRASRPEEREA